MTNPLISVVIPAYNYGSTLSRAVESVIAQSSDSSSELIVIDDGSSDNTPQVIQALLLAHPASFRAIRKDNGGASSVRNRGIREARGDYLVFLDADDEMAPGALAVLEQHIGTHPTTRMIIGGHYSIDTSGRRREYLPAELPEVPLERLRSYLLEKSIALSNGACAMHREVFACGDYPERFRSAEDIPVFSQTLANFPCTVLKQPLALIYKHDDSLRHQFSHAKAGGLDLVDEVFSPQRLGREFQALKGAFRLQRCLSLFRSAYLAGEVDVAKGFFRTALKEDWRVLLKTSYLRKALRLWLGFRL